MNNNPMYCSLMNYTPPAGCTTRFSRGQLAATAPSSARLSETAAAPDHGGLWEAPFGFWRWLHPVFPSSWWSNPGVDWDQDRQRTTATTVRAPLSFVAGSDQTFSSQNRAAYLAGSGQETGQVNVGPVELVAGFQPVLAEGCSPGRHYVFFSRNDDEPELLSYRSTRHGGAANGGCLIDDLGPGLTTGGSPAAGDLCTQFGTRALSNWFEVLGASSHRARAASAVWWNGRMHVVWSSVAGGLYHAHASGCNATSGELTAWSPTQTLVAPPAAGATAQIQGQMSLQIWNVEPGPHFTSSQALGLIYARPSQNAYVYQFLNPGTATWNGPFQIWTNSTSSPGQIATIPAGMGVTATPFPSRNLDGVDPAARTVCAAFLTPLENPQPPDTFPQRVTFACLQPTDLLLRWRDVTSQVFGNAPFATWGQVGLTYRPSRYTSGGRAWATHRGSFWMTFAERDQEHAQQWARPRITISRPVNTAASLRPHTMTNTGWLFRHISHDVGNPQEPLWEVSRNAWYGNAWTYLAPGTGVALLDTENVGAMKGAWTRMVPVAQPPPQHTPLLMFDPIADGTWDGNFCDVNDYLLMGRQMCSSVRALVATGWAGPSCGNPAGWQAQWFQPALPNGCGRVTAHAR